MDRYKKSLFKTIGTLTFSNLIHITVISDLSKSDYIENYVIIKTCMLFSHDVLVREGAGTAGPDLKQRRPSTALLFVTVYGNSQNKESTLPLYRYVMN